MVWRSWRADCRHPGATRVPLRLAASTTLIRHHACQIVHSFSAHSVAPCTGAWKPFCVQLHNFFISEPEKTVFQGYDSLLRLRNRHVGVLRICPTEDQETADGPLQAASFNGCTSHLCMASKTSFAAAWRDRPITLVVPFAHSESSKSIARIIGVNSSAELGQPIVVEKFPGAGARLAHKYVARYAANGRTLLLVSYLSILPARRRR
ncbi:hypothetical protein GEM_4683 [Burkholderia cepacia GG4]|uniref:Uncharacterized protein n=1 Tax=Burkholderia cepacia GG4 TaxID=1009846 RepID=A0A9W3K5F9_BURCE|nr:hypothetical protein GEM_4683 [Burkholderia cepacia GG4]